MDLLGSCVKFMGCKLSRASTVIGISPQLAQGIFVYITFWNAKNAEHRGTCDSEPPCPHQRPGMLWSLPECANTGMPGDATMATSALLHIRRQNYGAPPAWFARSCATSSARVSAAGVQLVPSPTAKRSYVRQVWKSSARGTPRWVLWVSLGAKKNQPKTHRWWSCWRCTNFSRCSWLSNPMAPRWTRCRERWPGVCRQSPGAQAWVETKHSALLGVNLSGFEPLNPECEVNLTITSRVLVCLWVLIPGSRKRCKSGMFYCWVYHMWACPRIEYLSIQSVNIVPNKNNS